MRKYLPVVILLTMVFGGLSFYIAKEVIASIRKKADVEKTEDKSKERWLQSFQEVDDNKNVKIIYRDWETDRKSTRLNSSHLKLSRMPSSA